MGEFGQIAEHHGRIGAGIVLVAQFFDRRGDVGAHQRIEQFDNARAVGEPKHLPYIFSPHRSSRGGAGLRSGMCDRLIEQRERIAHRTFRRTGNQRQRLRFRFDGLLGSDGLQMFDQTRGIDAAQIETLATR